MAYIEERRFLFTSSAMPEDTFSVVKFKGIEGISRLYEFEITLVSNEADIDIDAILRTSVTFKILRDEKETVFHGIAAYFEQLQEVDDKVFYRTLLVPRLWLSDQQHENQLFLDRTVPEIIEEILKQAGLTSIDYEFRLTRNYRPWEYICQYRETDFDFISRWMEREGIYYFFDQTESGEKMIITDNSTVHKDLPHDSTIYYSPPSSLITTEEEEIREFICRQTRLPKKVLLKDYNYRKPSLEIRGEAMVDPNSRGIVYLYGEHFKTPEEGNELAKIRAEEILCREKVYIGEGTATSMKSGYLFDLADHYRESCNQKYLIVEVEHQGSQTAYLTAGLQEDISEEEGELVYRNRFVAIPADVQFRPERKTEKPRFYGTINAKIDAAGDGQYAEIDKWGRYKVVLPFDMTGKGGGKASRWIRMAQPYAGQGFGMHFPLHKGTEVLLTFVDGDPDRPIIAGSVPNPETMSPVTESNHSQCVIRTGGGNQIHTEDRNGRQLIKLQSPTANSSIRIGAPNPHGDDGIAVDTHGNMWVDVQGDYIKGVDGSESVRISGSMRDIHVEHDDRLSVDQHRFIHVKGMQDVKVDNHLQYWIKSGRTMQVSSGGDTTTIYDGQTHTVHGTKTVTVHGDETYRINGNQTLIITGNQQKTIGSENRLYQGSKHSVHTGFVNDLFGGEKGEAFLGAKWEYFAGAKAAMALSMAADIFYGLKFTINASTSLDLNAGLRFGTSALEVKESSLRLSNAKGLHKLGAALHIFSMA